VADLKSQTTPPDIILPRGWLAADIERANTQAETHGWALRHVFGEVSHTLPNAPKPGGVLVPVSHR
jgi:hypothetical protein